MARKKLDRPTKSMKDAALRALHAAVVDPGVPRYTQVSAAKSLLQGNKDEAAEAEADKRPASCMFLPDSGRDPGITRLGIHDIDHQTVVIFDGSSEEGIADCARWREQMAARIEIDHPPDLVALPAPVKAPPLTPAERQRRRRERLAAAKAAQSASTSPAD